MKRTDVEVVARKTAFQGYFRVDRYRLRHRLFAGGWSSVVSREVFERGHAVAVLLYDPDLDRVALTEQFRVGAYAAGEDPWLLEIAAGIIEPGENPDDVVHREAREETGADIVALLPICKVYVSPGGATETIALYCGRIDSAKVGGIHGLTDEGEDIRVHVLDTDEAIGAMRDGRIKSAPAVITLQWLALNRTDLKRRWQSA